MITDSRFRPAWWLPGPHLQTIYPTLFRRRSPPPLERERLELEDGDFIDLDWTRAGNEPNRPVVLVLHGLEGSLESHYAGGILQTMTAAGYRAVLMYFRGCSGTPNRLRRSYHSGDTDDLQAVIRHIAQRHPVPVAVIGYSLGGNALLKWLGEANEHPAVGTAVAISVPFELQRAAARLTRGLSRIYQWYLLRKLRRSVTVKAAIHPPPVPLEQLASLNTFRKFDNAITAPLHGFAGVDDYYTRASSRQFLARIRIPTLIIHARDDPFVPADAIPAAAELAPCVTLELSRRGGHVGFVAGCIPFRPHYWLESRICAHLRQYVRVSPAGSPGPDSD